MSTHCGRYLPNYSRRDFLTRGTMGLGAAALSSLLARSAMATPASGSPSIAGGGVLGRPHFAPRAKRVIYLLQSGAPSHLDLFDDKPKLRELNGSELPDSVRGGQRLTGMTSGQASFPMAGSIFKFDRRGRGGLTMSELLPHTAGIADDMCLIKSMYTKAINHDPAVTFLQTGSQLPGRPSIGAWLSYGLGSMNDNLPTFVAMVTQGKTGQPLYARLWGNGFLPSEHQGVQFRAGRNPVLYLADPEGLGRDDRARQLATLRQLQQGQHDALGDPEIMARMAQYEMAFRMQTSVPEVSDTSNEPDYIFDLYGADSRKPGTYAANCLLARRLAERGVRFIQLFHRDWDHHSGLPNGIRQLCKETDQASAALVMDLKQRGMLEDTLIIWGGEFGRTCYSQGQLTPTNYGRDHHPRCFTIWMAGGGARPGYTHGATDDFGYNIAADGVHIYDFQATVLAMLGIDHERLTFLYQGRRFRLTDVHGSVVHNLMA